MMWKERRKIKILFNAFADKDSYNAQDLNARDIALRLNTEKFQSYLFVKKNYADKRLINKSNINLIRLPNIRFIRRFFFLKHMFSSKYDFIISGKVDPLNILYLKLRTIFRDKKKQIHTVENLRPAVHISGIKFDKKAQFIVLNSDFSFAISKKIQDTSKRWCGKELDLLYAVGIDLNVFFPSIEKSNKRKKVISCGTITERKQPNVFLEIAKRNLAYDFAWVGEGPLQNQIFDEMRNSRIFNFELHNNMPHPELAKTFRGSDLFLFPSIHEGFPKVIVEAMACGLPAIALSNYGPESIIDGKTGYVVESVKEMEEKMLYLLSNNDLLIRMKKNAAERAREFSWERIAKNYEHIINRISDG